MLVVVAGVAIPGGITSTITLVLAVQVTTVPSTHFFFPHLKYGPIRVMCGKLWIEKGKNICECGGA